MTAQIHIHPKNPAARVLGTKIGAGVVITRDVVYAAADGTWSPVKSGAVGLRPSSDQGFFVRPVKTVTVEAPSDAEMMALRTCSSHAVTGGLSEALYSLLRKLEVGSLLTEIGRAA